MRKTRRSEGRDWGQLWRSTGNAIPKQVLNETFQMAEIKAEEVKCVKSKVLYIFAYLGMGPRVSSALSFMGEVYINVRALHALNLI
jgi:hypothetical protein